MALSPERLTGLAVFAFVAALVNVAIVIHLLEDLLNGGNMVVVSGADKPVIADVHQLPQIQNAPFTQDDIVHELLGSAAGFLCLVLDFLTVLVGAGEEFYIVALQAFIACHGVSCHGTVGMTDMQIGTGVINGSGNIVFSLAHKESS